MWLAASLVGRMMAKAQCVSDATDSLFERPMVRMVGMNQLLDTTRASAELVAEPLLEPSLCHTRSHWSLDLGKQLSLAD